MSIIYYKFSEGNNKNGRNSNRRRRRNRVPLASVFADGLSPTDDGSGAAAGGETSGAASAGDKPVPPEAPPVVEAMKVLMAEVINVTHDPYKSTEEVKVR